MSESALNGERRDPGDERTNDVRTTGFETATDAGNGSDVSNAEGADLAGQLEVLTEENRRLRAEYARARRARYRRSALGLAALGALCGLVGFAFSEARTVLFALAGTGLFTAVLTYYLTPERFLAAAIGRDVYGALAENETALISELGLQDAAVYVAREGSNTPPAWLFVPHRDDYELPDADALERLFVVTDRERARGISLHPSAAALYEEWTRALADDVATNPDDLADQLAEGLTEQFELVGSATPDVDPNGKRLSITVTQSAYGPADRLDHPITSFLGVGVARALDAPVTVETTADEKGTIVTCRWSQ